MTQEALKLALEAMYPIAHNTTDDPRGQAYKAIAAIKEALAQPEQFCDANCVWTDHHPDCKLAQPEQEPVAWRTFDGEGGYDYRSYEDNESYADDWNKRNPNHKGWVDKLYTRSQRTWLGLTDEQIDACWNKDLWKEKQPHHIFAKAIEAKFKQKNGYAEEKNT